MGADYAARSTGGLNGPDSFSQRLISSIHFGPNEGEKVSATGDFTTLSPGSTDLYVSLDRCPANFAVRDRWLPDSRPPCPLHLLSRSCVMRLKNPECSMAPDSDLQVHDADTSDAVLVRYACRGHLPPGLCASCIISRPPQGNGVTLARPPPQWPPSAMLSSLGFESKNSSRSRDPRNDLRNNSKVI